MCMLTDDGNMTPALILKQLGHQLNAINLHLKAKMWELERQQKPVNNVVQLTRHT